MAANNDHVELRDKLLAHIYDEEHSDIPKKTYRISSMEDTEAVAPITIKAKTRLGAVIAYMDWNMDNSKLSYKYWSYLAIDYNQDIEEYGHILVDKFFNSELDEDIKEVKEIVISPFTGENTKSTKNR